MSRFKSYLIVTSFNVSSTEAHVNYPAVDTEAVTATEFWNNIIHQYFNNNHTNFVVQQQPY